MVLRLISWYNFKYKRSFDIGNLTFEIGSISYVLRSSIDSKLYIGCTNDLKKRFEEHNLGKVDATKYRLPMQLLYYEACLSKAKAFKRERYFKTGYGRRFLKERI